MHVSLCLSLLINPNAVPQFIKPKSIPFALGQQMEKELDRLEKAGVIDKWILILVWEPLWSRS